MGNLKYKQAHKAQGLCVDCSQEAEPERIRCKDHLITASYSTHKYHFKHRQKCIEQKKEKREENKKACQCPRCGAPLDLTEHGADEECIYCINCREKGN